MPRIRQALQAKRGPADNAPAAGAPKAPEGAESIAGGLQEGAAPSSEETVTGAEGKETVSGAEGNDSISGDTAADLAPIAPAPAAYVAASATVLPAADTLFGMPQAQTVLVNVPKAYRLTLGDYTVVQIAAGVQRLPVAHAEHPWSKAHGVTVINPDAAA